MTDRKYIHIETEIEQGLVSVIIPTYNRASLILETINSVLEQTYNKTEIIVVDDCSTDNTKEVIQKLINEHSEEKIRYELIQKGGAPVARSRGVEIARGEYIQFLDSDDVLHPEKFDKHVHFLRTNKEIQMTYCITELFHSIPGDMKATRWNFTPEPKISNFIQWPLWDTNAPLWKREAVIKMGRWATELLAWQDWEFHVRALSLGINCSGMDQVLCYLREHDDQRIDQKQKKPEKLNSFLQATVLVSKYLDQEAQENIEAREALSNRIRGIGMHFFEINKPAEARNALRFALSQRTSTVRRFYMELLCTLSYLPLGSSLALLVQSTCPMLGRIARRLKLLSREEGKADDQETIHSLRFLPRA